MKINLAKKKISNLSTLKAEINNEWNQLPSSLAVKLAASAVKVRSHVQRTSYKVSEKFTIIQEAKWISVLAASRRFGIDQSMVLRWKNNEKKFNNVVSDGTEDNLLYNSDQENSKIDDNEDLFKVVEEDSLSAEELED
ncbi:6615_t:CDS:2 [Cetraspora pellucida]|uniref:6615_t:CDS:1 n=1 Tax=Cetraspora pellucida TaxID=1433469 RepID=A0A9N9ATB6_9GLOM|nr:6615_t:CDS:2 [Cetraspora pellucida]